MQKFLAKDNITEEDKLSLNSAFEIYKKVLEENCKKELAGMSKKDKKNFMSFWKIKDFTDNDIWLCAI